MPNTAIAINLDRVYHTTSKCAYSLTRKHIHIQTFCIPLLSASKNRIDMKFVHMYLFSINEHFSADSALLSNLNRFDCVYECMMNIVHRAIYGLLYLNFQYITKPVLYSIPKYSVLNCFFVTNEVK